MIYLTLDTNVWLSLIVTAATEGEHSNLLDELLFWIENGHLKYILPANMREEWDRNKEEKVKSVMNSSEELMKRFMVVFAGTDAFNTISQSDKLQQFIRSHITRIDNVFRTKSEIAPHNTKTIKEAARINLACLAPCHSKDSFRDAINILSLVEYSNARGYKKGIYSTINYKDFSLNKENKYKLHPQLEQLFNGVKMEYVFYEPETNKLFNIHLRPHLPNYLKYLQAQREIEKEKKLEEEKHAKEEVFMPKDIDAEFLDTIKIIDAIIIKKEPNAVDRDILKMLINRDENYRKYLLKKVGDNGMV